MEAELYQSVVKGLQNNRGENNCFLNVVIQSLWRLHSFRKKFLEWTNHDCSDIHSQSSEITCVYCALTVRKMWILDEI